MCSITSTPPKDLALQNLVVRESLAACDLTARTINGHKIPNHLFSCINIGGTSVCATHGEITFTVDGFNQGRWNSNELVVGKDLLFENADLNAGYFCNNCLYFISIPEKRCKSLYFGNLLAPEKLVRARDRSRGRQNQ